jgi:hypothetical protein
MSATLLDHMPAYRAAPGELVLSRAYAAEVPPELILPILDIERSSQFMRCVPIAASLAVEGSADAADFAINSEVEQYKIHTGWQTPSSATETSASYWSNVDRLARFVGASFSNLFVEPDYHDSHYPAGVAVVMEHRRTTTDPHVPLENRFKPTFSGTTEFAKNVAPDKFGAHLDLVHPSPILIGFIARGGGTIVREGIYHALDPLSSQAELNATGDELYARQLPDDELHFGDARTLMHEAPESQEGWRDHIRFYVAPEHPAAT